MSRFHILLLLHLVLLTLGATSLTAATVFMDGRIQWQYFQYFSQSGWGKPYPFPFTLPVVCTYLAAYATGVAAYRVLYRRGATMIGGTGILLCAIGFASFAYELAHWFSDFYGSWILSAPAPLMVLAIVALLRWNYLTIDLPASNGPASP